MSIARDEHEKEKKENEKCVCVCVCVCVEEEIRGGGARSSGVQCLTKKS